jgi:hypothetical protein
MSALSRISVLLGSDSDKTDVIYSSYKYGDIKPEWIIHEGYLEYLYGDALFKSLCKFKLIKRKIFFFLFLVKKYLIVLTCILNDKNEYMVILYLYPDKTKNPYKYFQLDKNDQ